MKPIAPSKLLTEENRVFRSALALGVRENLAFQVRRRERWLRVGRPILKVFGRKRLERYNQETLHLTGLIAALDQSCRFYQGGPQT